VVNRPANPLTTGDAGVPRCRLDEQRKHRCAQAAGTRNARVTPNLHSTGKAVWCASCSSDRCVSDEATTRTTAVVLPFPFVRGRRPAAWWERLLQRLRYGDLAAHGRSHLRVGSRPRPNRVIDWPRPSGSAQHSR